MKNKWVKPLILAVIIVALLAIAVMVGIVLKKNIGSGEPVQTATDAAAQTTTSAPTEVITTAPANRSGMVEEDGVMRYYVDNVLQTNAIVGSDAEGYYYADPEGVINMNYCDGVNIDGVDWNVIEGKAYAVSDDWDTTLHYALQMVAKCTDTTMTREQKLRAAFDYIKTNYLEGVPHDPPYREMDWPVVCANDIFVGGKGDCFSYGAAFAFVGKAVGCEECYACNSGGHGWAELDGLCYDPEWDMHNSEYNHFGVAPGDDCDVRYFESLTEGVDWMKIKL